MGLPVLVVDDSTLARRLLINALPEAWDVEITQAANGADAVTAYREGRASVMFLDLTMPGMTGFDVLETDVGTIAKADVDRQRLLCHA